MISIGTITGASHIGTPAGMKWVKKWMPLRAMATSVTPRNTTMASAKVTMMWLVTVKL